MPMIGDLQSFALPDLLRTLGNAHQSGQLSIWSGDGVYRIWLYQGSVTAAIAPQIEGTLKMLCLGVMDSSRGQLLQPLRPTATALSEPLGDWLSQKNWLTEDERAIVFNLQTHMGLYPLFELASGQFYFVGNMVPLPYWEMTGLKLTALEAIAQGLDLVNGKTSYSIDLPSVDLEFLTIATTTTIRLSLLDRRLLQWFGKTNTIQSLCQILNVEPLELQKACKRLLHLRLIKAVTSDSSPAQLPPLPQSKVKENISSLVPEIVPSEATHSLVQRIAAALNTPVMSKSK